MIYLNKIHLSFLCTAALIAETPPTSAAKAEEAQIRLDEGPETLIIPEEISRCYQGTPKPFEMTDLTYAAGDYHGVPDLETAWDGSVLFLAHHRGYGLYRPAGKPGKLPLEPVEVGSLTDAERGPRYGGLKWRLGRFFSRSGHEIQVFDPSAKVWKSHFKAGRLFSEFEILPDGHILLLSPTKRPPMDSPWLHHLEMSLNKGTEPVVLAELFDPARPGKAEQVYPYPGPIADAIGKLNEFPLIDQTCRLGNLFLFASANAGHLYVFDAQARSLRMLSAPWPKLDGPYLQSLAPPAPQDGARQGTTKVSCLSFPWKILIYPQPSGKALIVIMRHSGIDGNFEEERRRQERSQGNQYAPIAKIYSEAEKKAWAWMEFYTFDPRTRELVRLRKAPLEAIRADPAELWLTPEGDCIALSELGLPGPDDY